MTNILFVKYRYYSAQNIINGVHIPKRWNVNE